MYRVIEELVPFMSSTLHTSLAWAARPPLWKSRLSSTEILWIEEFQSRTLRSTNAKHLSSHLVLVELLMEGQALHSAPHIKHDEANGGV